MKRSTYEEDLAYLLDLARVEPKPQPPPKSEKPKVARLVDHERSTEGVIDAATNANLALAERMERETMESRRQARIAKELAEYHQENPLWHKLCSWQQSVLDAQERVRGSFGEIPEKGIYSPVARFEREMEDK